MVQAGSQGVDPAGLGAQRDPHFLQAGLERLLAFGKVVEGLAKQILEGAAHGAADELANHGRHLGGALGGVKLEVGHGSG